MHIGNILYANNQQCNLVPAINGIFLHACNAPERIIDAIYQMDASISASSINNAINSLSAQTKVDLQEMGQSMLVGYALDNFDITFKRSTGTVEDPASYMVHLTSGLVFNLAHTSIENLKYSSMLWEKSKYNDKRRGSSQRPDPHKLFNLHKETMTPGSLTHREDFCRWKFAIDLCTHGPEYFSQFLDHIKPPRDIEKIPPLATKSIPLKSMKYHNSTVEGNLQAIFDSLQQTGVSDIDELAAKTNIPGLEEVVLFFYGDLGTWERIELAQARRAIEGTSRQRLQFMIFIPGLFHVKMACADAIHRIFISPKGLHQDKATMMSLIELFYPNLTSKIINNKAGFRVLNDCIVRVGISDRLECWRIFLADKWPGCDSLQDFADHKPNLHLIETFATELARQYASSIEHLEKYCFETADNRDTLFENTLTRIDYILLYEEFSYAVRSGDVGRVETSLRRWIPIFKATGKHKYATHILNFLTSVHYDYPEDLKKAVRYNWLCNPTGKPMGFRGVDWLVELYNLYTKVEYGGSGSNYTVDRVVKESVLIQLFRDCKEIVEKQYHITPKTMRHGERDLTETYAAMARLIQSTSQLTFTAGRTAEHSIPDYFSIGMAKYNSDLSKPEMGFDPITDDIDEAVTEEDLAVDEED